MGSVSMLSEKCNKCPYVNDCDHKKMEAGAYYEELQENVTISISQQLSMPLARETMKINDGRGNIVTVFKDDIEKQISERLFKDRFLHFGA